MADEEEKKEEEEKEKESSNEESGEETLSEPELKAAKGMLEFLLQQAYKEAQGNIEKLKEDAKGEEDEEKAKLKRQQALILEERASSTFKQKQQEVAAYIEKLGEVAKESGAPISILSKASNAKEIEEIGKAWSKGHKKPEPPKREEEGDKKEEEKPQGEQGGKKVDSGVSGLGTVGDESWRKLSPSEKIKLGFQMRDMKK